MQFTRKIFVMLLLTACGISVCFIFWQVDIQYRTPTPIPANFQLVDQVNLDDLDEKVKNMKGDFLLFHFYNPECPCSKFNIKHIKELQFKYQKRLKIVAIIPPWGNIKEAQNQCDFIHEVIYDEKYSLSQACGVYSTPQAVLFNPEGKMIYKGNYNLNRYCSNKETQFVRLTLEENLSGDANHNPQKNSLPAYGCSIY